MHMIVHSEYSNSDLDIIYEVCVGKRNVADEIWKLPLEFFSILAFPITC